MKIDQIIRNLENEILPALKNMAGQTQPKQIQTRQTRKPRSCKYNFTPVMPEMSKLLAEGYGLMRLAKRYGVSATTINRSLKKHGLQTQGQKMGLRIR